MNPKSKTRLKKFTVYFFLILAAHIFQNVITFFPKLGGVRPVLLISAVIGVAMFEGEIVGAVAGIFAGALWDTVTVFADGYNALILMAICAVSGVILRIFLQNNMLTFVLVNTVVTVFYFITYALFFVTSRGIDNAGWLFIRYYLPMALYSVALTPLCYLVINFVNRKIPVKYIEY